MNISLDITVLKSSSFFKDSDPYFLSHYQRILKLYEFAFTKTKRISYLNFFLLNMNQKELKSFNPFLRVYGERIRFKWYMYNIPLKIPLLHYEQIKFFLSHRNSKLGIFFMLPCKILRKNQQNSVLYQLIYPLYKTLKCIFITRQNFQQLNHLLAQFHFS